MSTGLNRIADGASLGRLPYNANLLAAETQTLSQGGVGVLGGAVVTAGTGLVVNVSDGVVQGARAVSVPAFSGTAPDNATNYVWLGFTQPDTTATGYDMSGNPLYVGSLVFTATFAQPGGNLACLGRVTTASGAITLIESVGRMTLARWTGLQTFQIGDGLSFDSGASTLTTAGGFGNTLKTVAGSNITLSATEAAADNLFLSGTPGAGRNIIVPVVFGKGYWVMNQTDSTMTVKTPSGSGVAVASGKTAAVIGDGTNIIRRTADA